MRRAQNQNRPPSLVGRRSVAGKTVDNNFSLQEENSASET
jgi:hypothetical protein